MTSLALVRAGLARHAVAHAAAAVGVAVAAMVLAGALLLGSSLRQSLRDVAIGRLGWVERALLTERPFRAALADGLPGRVAPVLVARASARVPGAAAIGKVMVLGVDERFFGADGPPAGWPGQGVWINDECADSLKAESTRLALTLGPAGGGPPRESLLGQADDKSAPWEVAITGRLTGTMAHFQLSEGTGPARVAVVPITLLQERLSLPGRANALLSDGASGLDSALAAALQPEDHGLVIRTPASRAVDAFALLEKATGNRRLEAFRRLPRHDATAAFGREGAPTREKLEAFYTRERGYILVEGAGLYLTAKSVAAVERAAGKLNLPCSPVLVHLANSISLKDGQGKGAMVPYSVVAATRPVPGLTPAVGDLGDHGIALVDWKGSPLAGAAPESDVELHYFPVESGGAPREAAPAPFKLKGRIPQEGMATDAAMAPEFPGITDRAEMGEWSAPFPIDLKRVSARDEAYWREFRAAPKAYISWEAGKRLWAGRFGEATSVRVGIPPGTGIDATVAALRDALRSELGASEAGLVFRDTRRSALEAIAQGSDFGGLYLGFSSFILVAGLALTALLFRLGLERRTGEIGVLKAIGYRDSHVRNLFLAEGAVVALGGACVGALASMAYTPALLAYLAATWPDASLGRVLKPAFDPVAMGLGGLMAFAAGIVSIIFSMRDLVKMQPLALLRGGTRQLDESVLKRPRAGWVGSVGVLLAGTALAVCSPLLPPGEPRSGGFFTAGLLFLTAGILALRAALRVVLRLPLRATNAWPLAMLAARNAARRPARSLVTAGLLATATFLLVAVEAFRREAHPPVADDALAVWAELEVPLVVDPRSAEGQSALLDGVERAFRDNPAEASRRREEAKALLGRVSFIPVRLAGEGEAGCLNLTRPDQPRVVAAPAGALKDSDLPVAARDGRADASLAAEIDQASTPPSAAGEASSLTWILKKSPGDILVINPDGAKVRVAAALHDGPFPSEILIGEKAFLQLFPGAEGWRVVLARASSADISAVVDLLGTAWADKGAEVVPLVMRVNKYLAVENSYLATFQALGGLGLVLGTAGLAVVLLRAMWERRGELALLSALGYRPGRLTTLVMLETGALLVAGLGVGAVSALLAVLPHGGVNRASVPGLIVTLAACLATGLVAGGLAATVARKVRVIEALRQEA